MELTVKYFFNRRFIFQGLPWIRINTAALGRYIFLVGRLRLELPCIRVNVVFAKYAECVVYFEKYKKENNNKIITLQF
jgi:hypothetical protein